MNLNPLMDQGIAKIMKTAGRFYLNNATGRSFLAKMVAAQKQSARLRRSQEEEGLHVPPLLIASISSRCNLRCAGCYARASGACGDDATTELELGGWRAIFSEAQALGISFILLAGGEPLLRPDILELAARYPSIAFPVFTNGAMMDGDMLRLFQRHRNLVPVFSMEGGAAETDIRRGDGTYSRIQGIMEQLKARHILFGVSITVTRENMAAVLDLDFAREIRRKGCGLLLYVEYVPVEEGTGHLALGKDAPEIMGTATANLKESFQDMIVLSFPGDEAAMGGCLASGRGFFHINPQGGAEPCPFSPYSRHSLRDNTIAAVLRSGFFADLRELAGSREHRGGCTLFDCKEQVKSLAAK